MLGKTAKVACATMFTVSSLMLKTRSCLAALLDKNEKCVWLVLALSTAEMKVVICLYGLLLGL